MPHHRDIFGDALTFLNARIVLFLCFRFQVLKSADCRQHLHFFITPFKCVPFCKQCSWYLFGTSCHDSVNTLRPRQNGRHFADDTFKRIFLNENVAISIKMSLKGS